MPGLGEPEPQCSADGLRVSWLNGAMQAKRVLALPEADGESSGYHCRFSTVNQRPAGQGVEIQLCMALW